MAENNVYKIFVSIENFAGITNNLDAVVGKKTNYMVVLVAFA